MKNSNCCTWKTSVPSYIQDELSDVDLAMFEEHLDGCFDCSEEVSEIRELIAKIQKIPVEPSRPGFVYEVMKKIHAYDAAADAVPGLRQKPRSILFAPIAACFIIGAVIGYYLLHFAGGLRYQPFEAGERPACDSYADSGMYAVTAFDETETIDKALNWFIAIQESEGAWTPEKWGGHENLKSGLTALVLLAFVGNNGDFSQSPYANAVHNGAEFLVRQQSPEGYFGPRCGAMMYNHGISTLALLEIYALTGDKKLIRPINRALNYILLTQSPSGGWGYSVNTQGSENTSISAWQLNALLLASAQGWHNTKPAIEKGICWLKSLTDKQGYTGYHKSNDFPYGSETLTAMGAFCLFAGNYEKMNTDEHGINIRNSLKKITSKQTDTDYYRFFFISYALHATEDISGARWLDGLRKTLVSTQVKSGDYTGSWEPDDRWSTTGGRIYTTAMAALSLQATQHTPAVINLMKNIR